MMMKRYTIPLAAEGWVFILPLSGATAMLFAITWTWDGFVTFVFTLFVLFLFRARTARSMKGEGVWYRPLTAEWWR
jgi:hypothetical protein